MTPQAAKKRLANEKEWASSNTYSTGPVKTLKECKDRWSMQEVMDELDVSRYTIHRKIKSGLFPKPLMKSGRNLYFKRTDIERWMEDNPAYVKNEYTPKTVPGAIGVAFTEKEQKRIKEASLFLNEEPKLLQCHETSRIFAGTNGTFASGERLFILIGLSS